MPLVHTRSTAEEGRRILLTVRIAVPVLIVGFWALPMLHLAMEPPGDRSWFSSIGFAVAGTIFFLVVGYLLSRFAKQNIAADAAFICRVDASVFEQISPVAHAGDTFSVAISDIIALERESSTSDDRQYDYYIRLSPRERHQIATNYGNPADAFMAELQTLRPDLTLTDCA